MQVKYLLNNKGLLNKISLYTVTLLARQPTVLMSDEIVISINNLFKLPALGAGVILVTFLCISYGRKVKVNVFFIFPVARHQLTFGTLLSEFGLLSRSIESSITRVSQCHEEHDFACSILYWIHNIQYSM